VSSFELTSADYEPGAVIVPAPEVFDAIIVDCKLADAQLARRALYTHDESTVWSIEIGRDASQAVLPVRAGFASSGLG
jgi:hypothetical protein